MAPRSIRGAIFVFETPNPGNMERLSRPTAIDPSLDRGENRMIAEGGCMRLIYAAAMIAILAVPAYGQGAVPGPPPAPPKSRQQIESERTADQAYKDSLKNIPDKPAADPWGIARTADTPKATAKTNSAKPPAKTGSTTN
jgi:hypothetical protein